MIDNYLEYAKRRRRWCITDAIRAGRIYRSNSVEWMQGFYRGMALEADCQGQYWKQLQKSLEAHIEYACTHSSPEVWEAFSRKLLS